MRKGEVACRVSPSSALVAGTNGNNGKLTFADEQDPLSLFERLHGRSLPVRRYTLVLCSNSFSSVSGLLLVVVVARALLALDVCAPARRLMLLPVRLELLRAVAVQLGLSGAFLDLPLLLRLLLASESFMFDHSAVSSPGESAHLAPSVKREPGD